MSELSEQLTGLSACKEAVEWAEGYETLAEAWAVCERGDWMLWLCGRMSVVQRDGWPTQQEVALAACDCAELALPIYEAWRPNDDRVRRCLEVTREWAHGRATMEDLERARSAANAAANEAYAYDAACPGSAAAAITAAAHASAYAATDAADAYGYPVDAATAAAHAKALKQCADIFRTRLKPGKL